MLRRFCVLISVCCQGRYDFYHKIYCSKKMLLQYFVAGQNKPCDFTQETKIRFMRFEQTKRNCAFCLYFVHKITTICLNIREFSLLYYRQ